MRYVKQLESISREKQLQQHKLLWLRHIHRFGGGEAAARTVYVAKPHQFVLLQLFLSQDTLKLFNVSNMSKLSNLSNVSNLSTVIQSYSHTVQTIIFTTFLCLYLLDVLASYY